MRVNFQGCGKVFSFDVLATSLIKHIRAVARYYLGASSNIALFYQGLWLRDGTELQHYGVPNGSTFQVELRYQSSSVHDEPYDAFSG